MKRSFLLVVLLFCLTAFTTTLSAQTVPCIYALDLTDQTGDGWNGASILVSINDVSTQYTLADGSARRIYLSLNDGDALRIVFNPGLFDEEIFVRLEDQTGMERFFGSGFSFRPGQEIFSMTVSCPTCPVPPASSLSIDDVRAFTAELSWISPDPEGEYLLEYGPAGFMSGTGTQLVTAEGAARLTELDENQSYDFYLSSLCAAGDTSMQLGPYSFKTLWANNVGVTGIIMPETSCALTTADSVFLQLKNFGGEPQSLVPFVYAINGVEQSIDMPRDGVYTGVLGKDSVDVVAFDRTFDFSQAGEYEITAWTALEADSMLMNDTLTTTIVSVPEINSFPYVDNFEAWGGGWTIGSDSENASWNYGYPNGATINTTTNGAGLWATNTNGVHNENERSYLVSPCLDFSTLEEAPYMTFDLQLDVETCCDAFWMEASTDGGESWTKINAAGTAVNWYNSSLNVWKGNGGKEGWFRVVNTLDGLQGEADVRLRFVLRSDFSGNLDGAAMDNFQISLPGAIDLAATELANLGEDACGQVGDQLMMSVFNLSAATLSGFDINYQINGQEVVTQNVGTQGVAAGSSRSYAFNEGFDSSVPGVYDIKAWVSAANDVTTTNDTSYFRLVTALPLPYQEDFERGAVPSNWTVDDDIIVSDDHNAGSNVLADNLFSGDQSMIATTPVFGPVAATDSITFDYRMVDFAQDGNTGHQLAAGDMIQVSISADCGQTFTPVLTINQTNHTTTAAFTQGVINLADYEGAFVQLRFEASWGMGDYWVDIDNVGLVKCPADIGVELAVEPADPEGNQSRITALPQSGSAPYTFEWDTGALMSSIVEPNGSYSVTVTDKFGCTGFATFQVTKVEEIETITDLRIAPNPTTGYTELNVRFEQPTDLQVQVLNTVGQQLFSTRERNAQQFSYAFDLSRQPAGLYLLRLVADGKVHTEKIIRN